MEKCIFYPTKLNGTINVPGSKSETHRYLIGASLSDGRTVIENPLICNDTKATCECIERLGGSVVFENNSLIVEPVIKSGDFTAVNCGESGSTARFFLPILSVLREKSFITGENSLLKRPFGEMLRLLREKGSVILTEGDNIPATVFSKPESGDFYIRTNISSQVSSGLMFSLPLLSGDSRIIFTGHPSSEQYIKLTREILKEFSIEEEYDGQIIKIKGGQNYKTPGRVCVKSDCSFFNLWYGIGKMGSHIEINNRGNDIERMNFPEIKGREYIDKIFGPVGKSENIEEKIVIEADDCIDSVPIIMVCAASTNKTVVIKGVRRLAFKECDRYEGMIELINNLGGEAFGPDPDTLVVRGHGKLKGGTVNSRNDHRLVMAGVAASTISENPVEIINEKAVSKSYPEFIKDYKKLGGNADVINIR